MPGVAAVCRMWILGALVGLAGCESYAPLPLAEEPSLAASLASLRHDGVPLDAPLRVSDVTRLAVQNNPELRAARARRGIAEAQVLEAGLLPNPSLGGNVAGNITSPAATTTAWSAGLTQDIKSLVTLAARRRAAQQSARQVDAELLWQEWQVIGKARLLAVDLIEGEKFRRLLHEATDLLAERSRKSERALEQGNVTLAAVAPDVAALQAGRAQLDNLDQLQQSRRHQLNALLGLVAQTALRLQETPDLPPLDPARIAELLPQLPTRRPDLVALQLGYGAQEAQVRAAILAQFPALVVGLNGGIDNTNDYFLGPTVTIDLPIFDRNQGNIAIARATRQQLHDEYAARVNGADGEVQAMLDAIPLLSSQLERLRHELEGVARAALRAEDAFKAGNLDERSYVDFVSARLAKEQQIVAIEQSLLELQVAMATLTGEGMPPIALPSDEPQS